MIKSSQIQVVLRDLKAKRDKLDELIDSLEDIYEVQGIEEEFEGLKEVASEAANGGQLPQVFSLKALIPTIMKPGREYRAKELQKELAAVGREAPYPSITSTLSVLLQKGEVRRVEPGVYARKGGE